MENLNYQTIERVCRKLNLDPIAVIDAIGTEWINKRGKFTKRLAAYLKSRGITQKSIELFKLGFAPNFWESVSKFLIKKGYSLKELELAGLVIKSERSSSGKSPYYDRFRGRIIFTLKDHRGNIVGFAGRVLNEEAYPEQERGAKYINTPETSIYVKGNILYGLDITKEAIKKENQAIITEGEIDTIASYQVGIHNIVAIKGSALTENQVKLLKRYTENIALALDTDLAGDVAARRGIEIADSLGLNIRVIELLYGKDPDECIKKDPVLWRKSIKQTIPIYDYMINSAIRRFDKTSPEGKKKIAEEVLPQFVKITNEIVKSHYIKKLALLLGVSEEAVVNQLNIIKKIQTRTKFSSFPPPSFAPPKKKSREELLEEYLLALIFQSEEPKITLSQVSEFISEEDFITFALKKAFISLKNYLLKKEKWDINAFLSQAPQELIPTFDRLYLLDLEKQVSDSQKRSFETKKAAKELANISIRRKIKDLAEKIKEKEIKKDTKSIEKISEEFRNLREKLKSLQDL